MGIKLLKSSDEKFEDYVGKTFLVFENDDDYDEFQQVYSLCDLRNLFDNQQKEIDGLESELYKYKSMYDELYFAVTDAVEKAEEIL